MESNSFLYHLHQSHQMLGAAVLVWHGWIQSSLLKCPVRTWKETAATCSKWAAQIHWQCCHHENNSMGLGLELIAFPFPPCTGKRWLVHLDCSLNVNTGPSQAVFSCYLQPAVQRETAQPLVLEAHITKPALQCFGGKQWVWWGQEYSSSFSAFLEKLSSEGFKEYTFSQHLI